MQCDKCKSEIVKVPKTIFQAFGNKYQCLKCGHYKVYDNLGWKETRNKKGKIIKKREWGGI